VSTLPVSPRSIWLALKARGVRPPDHAAVHAYVRALDVERIPELKETMRRIEQGVDRTADIPDLVSAIESAALGEGRAQAEPFQVETVPSGEGAGRRPSLPERSPHMEPPARTGAPPREDLALLRAHGVHVWASGAALKVELAPLGPAGDSEPAAHVQFTVQIEGTRKVGEKYDWTRKTIFQLTLRELPLVCAFLLGYAGKQIELSNHGPHADKSLKMDDQGGKFFLRLTAAGSPIVAVPVDCLDAYRCAEIALAALHLNRPTCPPEMQLAMLRRVGSMHTNRPAE
jgi:hypothetical protein